MKYKNEQAKIKFNIFLKSLIIVVKKVSLILLTVVLIIAIFISISFFRNVVFGESSMSEFKNNFFGIPTKKLLQINHQIENQYDTLKQWFSNLKSRISS